MSNHESESTKYNYWNTRILYLMNDTLDSTCSEYSLALLDQLFELNSRDNSAPILLVISSGGGDVSVMGSIIDVMSSIKAPVYTQAFGDVASAAAIILAAGEKGHRYVSPMSRVMIHEPFTSGVGGKLEEIEISRNELKTYRDQMYSLMHTYTGQPIKRLQSDMKKDKWFSSAESVAYGLADVNSISSILLNLKVSEKVSETKKIKKSIKLQEDTDK